MRHLFILLLCCLEISLAGAVYEDDVPNADLSQYEYSKNWDLIASLSRQDPSDHLISSINPDDIDSSLSAMENMLAINEMEGEIKFPNFASIDNSYLIGAHKNDSEKSDLLSQQKMIAVSPELKYIYENDKTQQWLHDYGSSLIRPEERDPAYVAHLEKETLESSSRWINQITPSAMTEDPNTLKTSDSFDFNQAGLDSITRFLGTTSASYIAISAASSGANDLKINTLGGSLHSHISDDPLGKSHSYSPENLPTPRKRKDTKNYAIVVGINNYEDRMSLRTCVNDARSIADLMMELGYEVILISDQTEDRPTKHNILNMAFDKIKDKDNLGNVIFYFSGHGTRAKNDMFYLIPQDANGEESSYISGYELKQRIKDFKNLAMIIDACNSEGLSHAIGDGQIMVASSMYNQSSNVEWTGSMSVFTSNLIKAIEEEKERNKRILLQRCFIKAHSDTVRWSQDHMISQEPVRIDHTGGIYYIN